MEGGGGAFWKPQIHSKPGPEESIGKGDTGNLERCHTGFYFLVANILYKYNT